MYRSDGVPNHDEHPELWDCLYEWCDVLTVNRVIIQVLGCRAASFELLWCCGIDRHSIWAEKGVQVGVVFAGMDDRINVLKHESVHCNNCVGTCHTSGTDNECGREKLSHFEQRKVNLLQVGRRYVQKVTKGARWELNEWVTYLKSAILSLYTQMLPRHISLICGIIAIMIRGSGFYTRLHCHLLYRYGNAFLGLNNWPGKQTKGFVSIWIIEMNALWFLFLLYWAKKRRTYRKME